MLSYVGALPLKAQDTIPVYRSALLTKMDEKNLSLKIAEKEAEMAHADFKQSKALYLPSVTASHTAMYTTNPLMAFGSKLNQEILTAQDFNPDLLNDPDAIDNYATEVLVLQPLLNLDGIHEREAAKIQSDAMALKAARTKEYLEFEVVKAYMQLQLGYEAVKVLYRAKKVANEGLSLIQDYYEEGLAQKSDLLSVRVRANEVENQLQYAISNVKNGSNYLALLLGEEMEGRVYLPKDRLIDSLFTIKYSDTLSTQRKDIMALDMAVEGYERMMTSDKMKFLPRINAFGSYQLYDDNLLGFDASGYLLGVSLSWQIFNGNKNVGQLQKSKAEFEKSQLESEQYKLKSKMELQKAIRQLADAENNVTLSRLAFEQSNEVYRIKKDRFEEGLEKTIDYLMAETQMFEKELKYRQAIFEYNLTSEYLNFLTR